jgi:hypothetical protein
VDGRCPARARCRHQRVPGERPARWVILTTRTLTCDPDSGDYRHPAVACRALHDLVRQEAVPPQTACGCVPGFAVPTVIAGRVDGNRFSLTLGACGLCGLAPRAGRDMQILTPT